MEFNRELEDLFSAATAWLRVRRNTVNALNIFPVPDGDTGTNMLHTLTAAAGAFGRPVQPLDRLCREIVVAGLMGARGNSGVIPANFLKGCFTALAGTAGPRPTRAGIAAALAAGRAQVYAGTSAPVEGTILTLITAVEQHAAALFDTDTPLTLADAIRDLRTHAQAALERTEHQMELLRTAGVVDAGACGFYYIIEGIDRRLAGRPLDEGARHEGFQPGMGTDGAGWRTAPEAEFCLVTVYTGREAPAAETAEIRGLLDRSYGGAAVESFYGGQPAYHFLIAVE
ncbi:MAG: DAK2 domain-containing protein [Planctomycetota bacterium]